MIQTPENKGTGGDKYGKAIDRMNGRTGIGNGNPYHGGCYQAGKHAQGRTGQILQEAYLPCTQNQRTASQGRKPTARTIKK